MRPDWPELDSRDQKKLEASVVFSFVNVLIALKGHSFLESIHH